MRIYTPHGAGRVFWSLGDPAFMRAVSGLSFVPISQLTADFSLIKYQQSRYGAMSALCWPEMKVAHALPDLQQEAEGDAVEAFAVRLCSLLTSIPQL